MHLLKTGLDRSLTNRNPLDLMAPEHLHHTQKALHTQMCEAKKIRTYYKLFAGAYTHAIYHTKWNIFPRLYT